MNAVAALGTARCNAMQKYYLLVGFLNQHIVISQLRQSLGELSELVIMRREERPATRLVVQVFGNSPGERNAVVGTGAPADFIKDYQAFRRGVVENVGGLSHLHHEGALSAT